MQWCKICILFLLIGIAVSKKAHRLKEKKHFPKDEADPEKNILDFLEEDEITEEVKQKSILDAELQLERFNAAKGGYHKDPCAKHKCGPGKVCEVDLYGEARCNCIKHCPEQADARRKVCSNHNETWDSDCELYQMRCRCTEGFEGCKREKYKHVHVDYYGPCKDIGKCTADELVDFPRRMRDWLFNVMQELARREELHGHSLRLEQEAEKSHDRKWVNAVIWKFCDLDVHPHDRHVSRHELFPIRAPLMAMEHCVAPFLDSCDVNDDHKISLLEWGNCLGLKESEIVDRCATINKG